MPDDDSIVVRVLTILAMPPMVVGAFIGAVGDLLGLLGLPLVVLGAVLQLPHDILQGNVDITVHREGGA